MTSARGHLVPGGRLAFGTLTVIPSGDVGEITQPVARTAMMLAPLAALPVGAGVAAAAWLAQWAHLPSAAVGLLAVGSGAVLTRGMHVDGLADMIDGLGGGWDRERALALMKTGDVGPMGVVGLIVVLGLQAASVAAVASHPLLLAVVWSLSRLACPALACGLPPARPGGMGAAMARSVSTAGLAAVAGAGTFILVGVAQLDGRPWAGVAVALAMMTAVAWTAGTARRVFGGITGDVFGAGIEFACAAGLLALAAGVA